MRAAILIIALLASGCVSQQERQARDESNCDRFGFKRGTDGFANCLMTAERDRERKDIELQKISRASLDATIASME